MPEEPDLKYAQEFAQLSEELNQEQHEQPTLERTATAAVETIDACDYCAISVRGPGETIKTLASTDPIVTRADDLQAQYGEGPCLDAIWDLDTYLVPDLRSEPRWPQWTPQAVALGIGSILSLRLEASSGDTIAGLNLYARQPHAFDHTDLAIASIFARHAGAALSGARSYDNLHAAIRSRQIIGVAQGILLQRFGTTLDQSFELLRRYSQDNNIKLRVLAENLVRAGGIHDDDQTHPASNVQEQLEESLGLSLADRPGV